MFPLKDNIPTDRLPVVTIALIAANVLAYLVLQRGGWEVTSLFSGEWSLAGEAAYPCDLSGQCPVGEPPPDHVSAPVSVLTSMFMHGGLLHLGGNMLFLWIFGNNVEDRLGRLGFAAFYLVGGIVATLAHVAVSRDSTVPSIGASGAIAAVMGAYLIWFPNARVRTIVIFVLVNVPAKVVLGVWFVLQFFTDPNESVAWMAHVGGFTFGVLVGLLLRGYGDRARPATTRYPDPWGSDYPRFGGRY